MSDIKKGDAEGFIRRVRSPSARRPTATTHRSTIQPRHMAYVGEGGTVFVVDEATGNREPLHPAVEADWLVTESATPCEFAWGAINAGAARLAHAILAHYLEVPRVSEDLYRSFLRQTVAVFPVRWRLRRSFVENWLTNRWSHMTDAQIREDLRG